MAPTSHTNVIEFLVMAGLKQDWKPLYEEGNERLRQKAENRYQERRARLSRRVKAIETRVSNSLSRGYAEGYFRTIAELRKDIESHGVRYRYKDMGYATLARLNEMLRDHGMEPIKVGLGVSASLLEKYGLKRSDTQS